MKSQFSLVIVAAVAVATAVACREASPPARAIAGPNFAVATDTGPGGGCGQPGNQCHIVADGDIVNAYWFDVTENVIRFGGVQAYRVGSVKSPAVFLEYSFSECDLSYSCTLVLAGYGVIPVTALSGNENQMILRANTSDVPDFFTYAGPTGIVSIDWEGNGILRQSQTGTFERSEPGFRERTTGTFSSVSATASGTVVGSPVPAAYSAQIGTGHNVTIDIFR
jgi:hypothetical protein